MESIYQKVKKYIQKNKKESFWDNAEVMMPKEKLRHLKNISLKNGKFFILPIDQGLEHGPVDFLDNPQSADPNFQFGLVKEVGFSAIAVQIGLAKKYWKKSIYRNDVPLILKLNGKTQIPGDAMAFSALNCSVKEAHDLGAEAVGYTLYVGSPRQGDDFSQFRMVREEAEKYNLPVIVWAYPRGEAINNNGGKDGVAAVEYAVRVAMELGADIVKFNFPHFPKDGFNEQGMFAKYNELKKLSEQELLMKVAQTAGNMGTLLSGGAAVSTKQVLDNAKMAMQAGIDGIIFGRNIWKREWNEAVSLAQKLKRILLEE